MEYSNLLGGMVYLLLTLNNFAIEETLLKTKLSTCDPEKLMSMLAIEIEADIHAYYPPILSSFIFLPSLTPN
jgi:hypothetical protein